MTLYKKLAEKRGKDFFLFLFLLFIAIGIFWTVNACGLGYTYDSELYLSIARQIASRDFLLIEGFQIKPPILPYIINLVGEENMAKFNFLCFLYMQAICFLWSFKIRRRFFRILFLIILAFSTPHLLITAFLWTEPIFMALFFSAIYLWDKYFKQGKIWILYLAIGILFILPFVRFASIFIIIPFLALVTFSLQYEKRRIILLSICLLILLIFSWVILFNKGFTERWARFIRPLLSLNFNDFFYNIFSYLKAVSSWFFPYSFSEIIKLPITILVVVLVTYKAAIDYICQKQILLSVIILTFTAYYFLMQFVFKVEYYSAERYLSPFYILFILYLFIALEDMIDLEKRQFMNKIVILGLLFLVLYSVLRTVKNVVFWNEVRCDNINFESMLFV